MTKMDMKQKQDLMVRLKDMIKMVMKLESMKMVKRDFMTQTDIWL